MALRQLSHYRLALVDECSDWMSKVICLLDQVLSEYATLFSDTFGVKFAKDALSFQIKQMISQIVFIENHLSELEQEISKFLKATNSVITTIIGIG